MIALRVQLAREQARLEADARDAERPRADHRRDARAAPPHRGAAPRRYRLSLDGRDLVVARFGVGQALRMQHLRFDTFDEARAAYFARLEELAQKGYLDATQD